MTRMLPIARFSDLSHPERPARNGRVPWSITPGSACSVVIRDADDHPLFIASPDIAARIVAAVNMVECVHIKDRDPKRIDEQS